MKRILRIVIGLGLVAYAVYSGNNWFYLGLIVLITGLVNWCPMEKLMGGCKDGNCSSGSCCNSNDETLESTCCTPISPVGFSANKIEILGTGCPNCIALEKVVNEAISQMQLNIPVVKVTAMNEIMKYQVMSTPGLVINGVVKSTGKLLSIDEVKNLLKEIK